MEVDFEAEPKLQRAQTRIRVQELLIAKLQEKCDALERDNRDVRELYSELNAKLFDKLAEFSHYRKNVSKMEANYMKRINKLKRQLRALQLEVGLEADPNPSSISRISSHRAHGANGSSGSGAPSSARSVGGGAGGSGSSAREAQLAKKNKALLADLDSKLRQFMELQLKYDDLQADLEDERRAKAKLMQEMDTIKQYEAKAVGGTQLKDLVLRKTTDRIEALERECRKLREENSNMKKALRLQSSSSLRLNGPSSSSASGTASSNSGSRSSRGSARRPKR